MAQWEHTHTHVHLPNDTVAILDTVFDGTNLNYETVAVESMQVNLFSNITRSTPRSHQPCIAKTISVAMSPLKYFDREAVWSGDILRK